MRFKFVGEYDSPVRGYLGNMISTGDIVELDGHLAEKAKLNPEYKAVRGRVKTEEVDGDQG